MTVEERRALLLELGLRLFGDRGLDEVSVEDIAREAGVSAGLLYHYFGSKREFHHAVTSSAMERLRAVTEPDTTLPPGEQLVGSLMAYLKYLRSDSNGWAWLLRGGAGDDQLAAIAEEFREVVARRVFAALPPGSQTPLSQLAVRGWIGSNTEMSLGWLRTGEPEAAVVVRLMVAVLLGALEAAEIDPPVLAAIRGQADAALADAGLAGADPAGRTPSASPAGG
jgi:AcrR family transcriptional regulator